MIAAILTIISIGFFIPVISEYLKTGLVPNFPTLIVCGFTMIAAIQSFFAGMQLQTIVQKNRQDFEMNLQRVENDKKNLEKIIRMREYAAIDIYCSTFFRRYIWKRK